MNANLFDTLLEPIFIVNQEFKVVYCNEPASALTEISIRKMLRQQPVLSDLFSGLVLDKALTEIQEQTAYKETVFKNPSGNEFRIQWTLQPFQANEWIIFFRDVTLEETLQRKYRGELEAKEEYINELKKAKQELENYSKNLEQMVADRTSEIRSMNKTMQALLDSLKQGFFIFNPEGTILPVFSKACEELYQRPPTDIKVWDYLKLTEKQVPGFQKWMSTVFAELLPFEDLSPLGPVVLPNNDGRTIKLEYYPIRSEENVIEGVVVMATDITELVEAQNEATKEKNHAQFILKLIQQQNDVLRFVKEAGNLLTDIQTTVETPWAQIDTDLFYRLLHTLKGGAATFSGDQIAKHCHESETVVSELIHNPDPKLVEKLKHEITLIAAAYDKYSADCKMILGPLAFSSERHVQMPESEMLKLIRDLKENSSSGPKVADHMLNHYLLEPISSFFMSYNDNLQKLSERLEKSLNPIKMMNGEILIWGAFYQPIFATFVHLFRNALDHGIELPHEREAAGKSAAGNMCVEFELGSGTNGLELVMLFKDDGRGIDPDKIKSKLEQKGVTLPNWDTQSLYETLFWEDMSLAKEVTDISGRGVGLSAVKALVEQNKGSVKVHSEVGKGTTFEIRLPYIKTPEALKPALPPVPKAS